MSDKKDKRKKGDKKDKKQFHSELKGFDIRINEFGEIVSNYDVDKLNEFLNEKVSDPRLSEGGKSEEE